MLKTLLVIAVILVSVTAIFIFLTNSSVIPVTQAREFSGQQKTLEGKIQYVYNNGKSVLLGFSYPHQGTFKVQIPKKAWGNFGQDFGSKIGRNLETKYKEGQTIQVTGKITWYQGDPVIYVSHPSQVQLRQ